MKTSSLSTMTLSWSNNIAQQQHEHSLLCDQSLLVDLCTHDCKSLHLAVTICATLVNTHTHIQRQLMTSYTISSAS